MPLGQPPAAFEVGAGRPDPPGGEVGHRAVEQGTGQHDRFAVLGQGGQDGVELLLRRVDPAGAQQQEAALLEQRGPVGGRDHHLGPVEQRQPLLGTPLFGLGVRERDEQAGGQFGLRGALRPGQQP